MCLQRDVENTAKKTTQLFSHDSYTLSLVRCELLQPISCMGPLNAPQEAAVGRSA